MRCDAWVDGQSPHQFALSYRLGGVTGHYWRGAFFLTPYATKLVDTDSLNKL